MENTNNVEVLYQLGRSEQKVAKIWNCDKTQGYLFSAQKFETLVAKAASDEYARPSLLQLVQKIREKRTSLQGPSQPKRKKTEVKIHLGWQMWHNEQHRYVQVRACTGGGSREVTFSASANYQDVITKSKELFFPNGMSNKGKEDDFTHSLADFKNNLVVEENFTVESYRKKNCLTQRPRMYLLSKQKNQPEDWELPDLEQFPNLDENSEFSLIDTETSEDEHETELTGLESNASTVDIDLTSDTGRNSNDLPAVNDLTDSNEDGDADESPSADDHNYTVSPVTLQPPRIPVCQICKDRFIDCFIECGHTYCTVCATELEERGRSCAVCRCQFDKSHSLFY